MNIERQEINNIKGLILDMDGVLWRGDQPIGNLVEVFSQIKSLGLRIALLTNNSASSVIQYLQKLEKFGVTLTEKQIITSSQATAIYLKSIFPPGGPVYVIGEIGLYEELEKEGFYLSVEDALAVVVGLDRNISYEKLTIATQIIRAGAKFIGTNPDETFPTPTGLVPGAGAIIEALRASSGVKPDIIGKPEPGMFQAALERLNLSPQETMVIGDRLGTDIAGAQFIGCRSALVLSGVTTWDEAKRWVPMPDYIINDLKSMLDIFSN